MSDLIQSDHRSGDATVSVSAKPAEGRQPIHSIQVVARKTGLTPHTIRVWERRYNAVSPQRSDTGRRFYSDAHVARLCLLHQATQVGYRIGRIAQLSTAELEALVTDERSASQAQSSAVSGIEQTRHDAEDTHVMACLEAVQRLDTVALERALAAAAVSLSVPVLLEAVVFRLMATVGENWRAGTMRLCHEHLATATVRSFLGTMMSSSHTVAGKAPVLLVTTPVGQHHELGALMVAVTAASSGWEVLYLGVNTPAEDIAFACAERAAHAVALSICYPPDDPTLPAQIRKLRQLLPAETPLLVGGQSAMGYQPILDDIGAVLPGRLNQLPAELDGLREPR